MEIAILALVAWLIWSRYLHHQEVKLLLERGAEWQALVEARERWQTRWGIVIGCIVLIIGLSIAAAGVFVPMRLQDRLSAEIMGTCVAAIGVLITAAHLIWQWRRAGHARSGTGDAR